MTVQFSRVQILNLIRNWVWFEELPDEAHQWLASRGTIVRHKKGQLIYAHGSPVTHVYGILEGTYRVYLVSRDGDETTLGEEAAGAWNPHFVPSDSPTYYGNCACASDTVCISYPLSVVEEFGAKWPLFYKGKYKEFLSRADIIGGRIELLSLHNLNVRLGVYFLRLAKLRGIEQPDGSVLIPQVDSQTEIGARVGGTRQRINALMNLWIKQGIIRTEKNSLSLLDPDRLMEEAEASGFDIAAYLGGWHGGWARA